MKSHLLPQADRVLLILKLPGRCPFIYDKNIMDLLQNNYEWEYTFAQIANTVLKFAATVPIFAVILFFH